MAKRFARKVKRAGKSATQFRFTSTFEYIDLSCNGTWRPEKLRVIWLRSHRRVQSTEVEFVVTEDNGPNGAEGRAVFDPPITVSLVVTLYRDPKKQEFEEKEYKYYIEHEDQSGKKILSSFNCDMSEYAGIPTSRHALEMNFKPVSRKINKSLLGITLESQFIKEGKDTDDDMQSTFSSMDPAQSVMYADDEDDIDEDDLDEAATLGIKAGNIEESTVTQTSGGGGTTEETGYLLMSTSSFITLGTGETLKRKEINRTLPPSKPPRSKSTENLLDAVGVAIEGGANNEAEGRTTLDSENKAIASESGNVSEDKSTTDPLPTVTVPLNDEVTDNVCSNTVGVDNTDNETNQKDSTIEQQEQHINTNMVLKEDIVKDTVKEEDTVKQDITVVEKHIDTIEQHITAVEHKNTIKEPAVKEKTTAVEDTEITAVQEHTDNVVVEEPAAVQEHTDNVVVEEPAAVQEHIDSAVVEEITAVQEAVIEDTVKQEITAGDVAVSAPPSVNLNAHSIVKATPTADSTTDCRCNDEMFNPKRLYKMPSKDSQPSSIPSVHSIPDVTLGPESSQAVSLERNGGKSLEGSPGEEIPQEEPDRQPDNNPFDEPQNPFDEQPPPAENPFDEQPPPSTTAPADTCTEGKNSALIDSWLPDVQFVDNNDVPVSRDRIDSADVIGLYFSAQWCPPCRRFLPKLLEFYNALKNNGKSFELIYVSNDNSRTEMIQYMAEQQMPWLAIPHGHPLIDKLKLNFKVRSIPLLVIVNASGDILDDNAKKAVENSHGAAASVVKQYMKWAERMTGEEEVKQKSIGILGSIKKALSSKEDEPAPSPPAPIEPMESLRESAESKSPKVEINDKFNKDELLRQLQDKEDLIRHLEEVNQSLKHTNEELNTDLRTMKSSLEQSEAKVKELEETTAQKREEYAKFQEHLKVQGWLFKKGAKGPTANVFRKRYFRLDQGSKLYYYKSQSEGTPQGYIDLVKIITVSEVSSAQQDKNNASFNIDCEGRVYQLLAHDETEMRKWISAIQYLKEYYKKKGHE